MARSFKPRKKYRSKPIKDEKIMTIGAFDRELIYVKNSYSMYSPDLKQVYYDCNGKYNPLIKGWVMKFEMEKQLVQKVKLLFPGENIRIIKVPKFVKDCIRAEPLIEKGMLTFKSRVEEEIFM